LLAVASIFNLLVTVSKSSVVDPDPHSAPLTQDPDPALFVSGFQDASKKLVFLFIIF
jgi:hypothetical protein